MKWSVIGCIVLFTLAACQEVPQDPVVPGDDTLVVDSFEDCVAAGNPVMESYPRQCRHGDRTFTEELEEPLTPPDEHRCTPEEQQAEICTMEYAPVCGSDGKTYGNGCQACSAGVSSYVLGTCASSD